MQGLPPAPEDEEAILPEIHGNSTTGAHPSTECEGTPKGKMHIYHKYIHEGGKCSHAVQREYEKDIQKEVQGLHEVDLGEKVALLEKVQAIWVSWWKDSEGEQEEREIVERDLGEMGKDQNQGQLFHRWDYLRGMVWENMRYLHHEWSSSAYFFYSFSSSSTIILNVGLFFMSLWVQFRNSFKNS